MSGRKNIVIMTGLVLAASLFAASLTAFLVANYCSRIHMQVLGQLYEDIIEIQPESESALLSALKEFRANHENGHELTADENIILRYGYSQSDFLTYGKMSGYSTGKKSWLPGQLFVLAGFLTGGLLYAVTIFLWRKKDAERINALTGYLEKVNTGSGGVLLYAGEDDFSKLQDEIYKTVTALYQTRDAAINAKENFAGNLYNIAHQIKTPITSISLSVQMMKEELSSVYLEEIRGQLSRLTHLEEALLVLSRIDSGTLSMDRKEVDVFTILMLAADNLQELFSKANVSVDIPESGEMAVNVDSDWTMEAVINLLKNCMEHTPSGGVVHCSYEQNPLYTQVCIWDTGAGFAKEDIPHLFERFYRGKDAKSGGIGIGLAFSKAIIESQNGTVSARNLPDGGACFEIRFYSH